MKTILILSIAFLLNACQKSNTADTFTNEEGMIRVFVCTRGCYQYLLEHDNHLYFPGELPENLKKDSVSVIFSGKLKDTETAINKPAPNDAPVFDFNARDIEISSIKEK